MTDREIMQMALDALEQYVGVVISVNDPNNWTPKVADAGRPARTAIEALRAALAQPEPEPVAIVTGTHGGYFVVTPTNRAMVLPIHMALYTAPSQREWQGLTDDEVAQAMFRAQAIITGPMQFKFAKEIEAALKAKNDRS